MVDEVWRKNRGGGGSMPQKVAVAGAHQSDGSTVRCGRGGSRTTPEALEALQGSPVVVRQTYSTGE
jgi:hypothetical protein